MTKKHFIALADMIREHNKRAKGGNYDPFTESQIYMLAWFCADQNPHFDRERWLAYINGICGPNGGKVATR